MSLKYYHAEPLANSLKSMVPLKEKGLAYDSIYVCLLYTSPSPRDCS